MKKYLFNGAMALIVGVFIGSCSHDDIGQISTVDEMTKSFDEMFKELYGPIAPNHNWGFNTVVAEEGEDEATETEAAGTRSTEKEDHTLAAMGLTKPTLKDGEAEHVMDYFQNNEGANSVGLDINKFFIIYVGGNTNVNIYSNWNESVNNGSVILDYLYIDGEHIAYDWNANGGPTLYISERNANNFTANNSYIPNFRTSEWKLAEIEYQGEIGYYVGLSAYGRKDETPEKYQITDYDRENYYDDWVFKIVPANPTTPSTPEPEPEDPTPTRDNPYIEYKSTTTTTYREIVDLGRVFCEDIATSTRGIKEDIDYNDIVFDARVWKYYDITQKTENGSTTTYNPSNISYKYDISMLAAGGTIPENVGINNVDVHDAFGVGLTFMVNTWTEKSTAFGQYNTPTNVMQPKNGYETISYTLSYNQLLDKSYVGIGSIPITVKYNTQNVKAMDNKDGSAPYKLCVPIGTLWPIERVNIKEAYPGFESFVNSPSNKFYEGSQISANLYTQAPTSRIQNDMNNGLTKGYWETVNTYTSSSYITVVWAGSISGDAAITLYNYSFSAGETLRFYGSGTIRVLDNNNQEVIGSIPMSGGYCDITISSGQATSLNGGTIIINGSNFSLTKIAVL